MIKVPLFYYPTHIALLDDDSLFLEETAAQLNTPCYRVKTYTNPRDSLDDLKSCKHIATLMETILIPHEEKEYEVHPFQINVNRIHALKNDLDKYRDISVFISDYNMPYMNGIDVMEQIKTDSCFKILLTGDADEEIAVNAFNQGIIQQYIKKHSKNLTDHLKKTCDDFTFKFFLTETLSYLPNSAAFILPDSPLFQLAFQSWFRDFVRKNRIVEYYLIEMRGAFLMIDDQKREHVLKIIHEDDFDMIASSVDPGQVPDSLLDRINNQEIYLMYYKDYRFRIPKPSQGWDDHVCPVIRAQLGDQSMMYCFRSF